MLYSGTDPESYITEYTLVYEDDRLRVGWSHEERRCSNLGTTQSRILPSILQCTKINVRLPSQLKPGWETRCGWVCG